MKHCILALSSVTYAMKAQKQLREDGMRAEIVRLDAAQTKRGCAYGVEVDCEARNAAPRSLRRAGIPFSEWVERK